NLSHNEYAPGLPVDCDGLEGRAANTTPLGRHGRPCCIRVVGFLLDCCEVLTFRPRARELRWVRLHCGDVKRRILRGFPDFSREASGSSVEWHEALPACLTWRALGERSPEESV